MMKPIDPSTIYRLFYPAVPAILCSRYEGAVSGMPVISAVALSGSPPRVGVAVAPTHSTYRTTVSSGAFSLSWMGKEQTRAVEMLGSTIRRRQEDKLRAVGLAHTDGRALDVPVPTACAAVLECSVFDDRDVGDHRLIIGDVKAAYATDDFDGYWTFKDYHPILYAGSRAGFATYDKILNRRARVPCRAPDCPGTRSGTA